jgi:hypothetical protein
MASNRKSTLYPLFAVAWLAWSQAATAALTCQKYEGAGTELSISYSDSNEYSRFEFAPTDNDGQWIGVVFEFFGTAPTNTLLEEISPSLRGKDLSEQFTRAFMAHLEEQMPYDSLSDMRFHELGGSIVTTFDTTIGDHRDLIAVYGRWDGADFQFFRAVVPIDGPYEQSEETALEAMHRMIRNCLSYED